MGFFLERHLEDAEINSDLISETFFVKKAVLYETSGNPARRHMQEFSPKRASLKWHGIGGKEENRIITICFPLLLSSPFPLLVSGGIV